MNGRSFSLGEFLNVIAVCGFFAWIVWATWRRRRERSGVAAICADEPYRAYDTSFDLTVLGRNLSETLREHSPDRAKGWAARDPEQWARAVAAAREFERGIDTDGNLAASLSAAFEQAGDTRDWAISFLVDQSGSMRDSPMHTVAGTLRWLSRRLADSGVTCGLYGFSTVGWQGGKVRQQWLWGGQPERPGRLCALLHIVYQPLGNALSEEDWEAMLHPDILRENVDGEAIQWALSELRKRVERNRLLIVVSDGAPVDDATLQQNGANYLEHHLLSVVRDAETSKDVTLAAVGVGFAVDRYYRHSKSAKGLDEVPAAIINLITNIVAVTENPCPPT